jgi:hypothetical protein
MSHTLTLESQPSSSLVRIDAARRELPREPFKAANALSEHPLFEPERIKKLLRAMPQDKVEIRGVQSAGADDSSYKRGPRITGVDPVETFERIAEKPTWMLLHDTWKLDPDYGKLREDYIAGLAAQFPEMQGELSDMGCWMFLSSGRCVVHFHADPDQSFLNQVHGSKTVYVYPARVLPETAMENLVYTGDQGAVVYDPRYEQQMFSPVHLGPGESVFLPLYAPHRVTNDEGVSVSWNVGFHTPKSRRRRTVHLVNLELRHMGIDPRPYDQSPMLDSLKVGMHLALRAKNKFFKGLRPKVKLG